MRQCLTHPWPDRRGRTGRGGGYGTSDPEAEGLARARGFVCFDTLAPPPWGRSLSNDPVREVHRAPLRERWIERWGLRASHVCRIRYASRSAAVPEPCVRPQLMPRSCRRRGGGVLPTGPTGFGA